MDIKKIVCAACGLSILGTGSDARMQANHNRICSRSHSAPPIAQPAQSSLIAEPDTLPDKIQAFQNTSFNDECCDAYDEESLHHTWKRKSNDDVIEDLYLHQRLLIKEYFDVESNAPAFFVRNAGSWKSYVKIFDYVRSNQLSQQQGTDLLQLFQDICRQHDVSIPLPSNMKTIEDACMRGIQMSYNIENDERANKGTDKDLHKVQISTYTLPTEFFGAGLGRNGRQQRMSSLHNVVSARMSLPHRIAEVLLDIDPNEFAFTAPPCCGEISQFSQGSVFRGLDADAKARHGPDAVALCLSISLDSATVNSTRNRSECPVVFSILNINGTATYHLIGYCPINLPYSDAELASMMSAQGIAVSAQKDILSYCKRQMKREYLDDILFPLLHLAEVGFRAQVGHGDMAKLVTIVPHICMIVGDTEELSRKLTGVRTGCRCCDSKDVHVYDPLKLANHTLRDDEEMENLIEEGGQEFLRKYVGIRKKREEILARRNRRQPKTKLEREREEEQRREDKNIRTRVHNSGLHPGKNPLYEYFERQRQLDLNSYHGAIVPDHLHTVQLGVICHCVSWVMQVVFAVKYLDRKTYSQSVALIDQRIINIETLQSYQFIKNTHFRCGISKFFSAYSSSPREVANVKGTAISTGTIHAWQYATLLLHLYFALVPSEGILPNNTKWWKDNFREIDGANPADGNVNILETVVSAMTCCLDHNFLSSKRCFDHESHDIFKYVTGNMRIHLHVLDRLRRYLCKMLTKRFPTKNERKQSRKKDDSFSGIKPHLCEHMVDNVKKFGPIIVTSDTQQTEGLLKYVCKTVFQQTSKKYKNLPKELINAYFKNCRAFALAKSLERKAVYRNPIVPKKKKKEADHYHFFSNFGNVELEKVSEKVWMFKVGSNMSKTASSLHPFLDSTSLMELLTENKIIPIQSKVFKALQQIMRSSKDDHEVYGLSIRTYKGVTIYNCHHIKDNHVKDSTMKHEPFTIHCNRAYKCDKVAMGKTRPVFNFIEVNYEDGCSYCQVMAIVEISVAVEGIKKQQYLVIARLEHQQKNKSPLPFGLYGYENRGKAIDVIPIESAFRPCIAYAYHESGRTVAFAADLHVGDLYFVIPYDRFGKTTNTKWPKHGKESLISQYYVDERVSMKTSSFPMYATIQIQQEQLHEVESLLRTQEDIMLQKRSRPHKTSRTQRKNLKHDDSDEEDVEDEDEEEAEDDDEEEDEEEVEDEEAAEDDEEEDEEEVEDEEEEDDDEEQEDEEQVEDEEEEDEEEVNDCDN